MADRQPPTCLRDLLPGDLVTRSIAGTMNMTLKVTETNSEIIRCGAYTFDPVTGAEIDDDLGWGPKHGITGSYIYVLPGGKVPPIFPIPEPETAPDGERH